MGRRTPAVSHLFFADDVLLFFQADPADFREIRRTIDTFCNLSGEMVNTDKSFIIMSPNFNPELANTIKDIIGTPIKESLGTYLGCPLEVNGRSTGVFSYVLERIINKITLWKFTMFSQARRLILINLILVAMASHILSAFLIPKTISRKINATMMKFWWKTDLARKPIY